VGRTLCISDVQSQEVIYVSDMTNLYNIKAMNRTPNH